MRKGTIFFMCIVLGGALFSIVFFYFGILRGSDEGSANVPRQVVVSEGGRAAVAPLPTEPGKKSSLPTPRPFPKTSEPTGPSTVVPVDTDPLGYALLAPQGATVMASGAKVLALPEFGSFAVYWLPEGVPIERMLVLLHDAHGTAYDEIADEIIAAKKHGYGLLALQWHTKATDTYQSAAAVYRSLSSVFDWLDQGGVQPKVRVLAGLGRGSTAAFEVLSFDRLGRRFFAGAGNFSGGIPSDAVIDPKLSTRPDPFFVSLIVGQAAEDLYAGLRFSLYCGQQDEERGVKVCEEMSQAQSLVVKYGGRVDVLVSSETLGHRGIRLDPLLYQGFIDWFIGLSVS